MPRKKRMKTSGFMKIVFTDIKRAVFSPRFILSVMGGLILYLLSVSGHGLIEAVRWGAKGHLLDFLGDAQTVALMDLLPFAAVLPYGAGFAEDVEFHAHHYFLARADSFKYRLGKLLAAAFSGGLALFLAMLIFLLLLLPFSTLKPSAVSTNFEYMDGVVQAGRWGWYFGFQLALTFLYGAIWAPLALFLSTFTSTRSLIYCCPVLFENILRRICSLVGVPGLYAVSFGMVDFAGPAEAFLFCAGVLLAPVAAFGFLFMISSKRRLRDA